MIKFRRKDVILIALLAAMALVWLLVIRIFLTDEGGQAQVTVDGQLYGVYELKGDYTVDIIEGDAVTNTLHITDGTVCMETAECPDKLCIKQGKLTDTSRSIVCLPNKVVVTIIGGNGSGLDSSTY